MKFLSMRSEAGQAPVIMAQAMPGESAVVGQLVEGGTGKVLLVAADSIAIVCRDVSVEGEAHGFALARRARRGELAKAKDAKGAQYLSIQLDPPAPEPAKEA